MRWMAAIGFLLCLALFAAAAAGFLILTENAGWIGVHGKYADVIGRFGESFLVANEAAAKTILASAAVFMLILDVLFLFSLARPREDVKKFIRFEDEAGEVVIEISALENCIQRMILEDFPVTWAHVTLDVPPPKVDPNVRGSVSIRLREMENAPEMARSIRTAAQERFEAILPLHRPMKIDVNLSLEPSAARAAPMAIPRPIPSAARRPTPSPLQAAIDPDPAAAGRADGPGHGSAPELPPVPSPGNERRRTPGRGATDRLIIPTISENPDAKRRTNTPNPPSAPDSVRPA
jgi:hypothetical protein